MSCRSAFCLFLGTLLLLGSGCSGDSGSTTSDRPSRDDDTVDDGKRDESRKREDRDDPTPGQCDCDPNEICQPESGECLPLDELPEGDLYGEVRLLRQFSPNGESLGKGSAVFFVYEKPPKLALQEFYTEDNELCLLNEGQSAPRRIQGRYLDAGPEVTFTVDGADETIVLKAWVDTGDGSYTYEDIKKGHPPADSRTMFDGEYLPLDETFAVEAAGGADVDAFSFDAGRMPEDFAVDPETAATDDLQMIVRWDPPQPAAMMEIIVEVGRERTLSCTVRDDGEAKVPMTGDSVQLRRTTARLATVDAGNDELQLLVRGVLARRHDTCYSNCGSSSRGH